MTRPLLDSVVDGISKTPSGDVFALPFEADLGGDQPSSAVVIPAPWPGNGPASDPRREGDPPHMGTASVRTRLRVRLAAISCATLAILGSAALAGCGGSTPSATPTTFSPGTSDSTTVSPTPSSTTGTASPSSTAQHSASPSAKPSRRHHHDRHATPTAAPATGGGGTAGLQHQALLALGGTAIVAGAGLITYRRRTTRGR
jgi:hypothetical protein